MKSWLIDTLGIVGFACVVGGIMWYILPVGIIVAGIMMLTLAVVGARKC